VKRHIPGLSVNSGIPEAALEGTFLVRVYSAEYRYESRKPFFAIKFALIQPKLPFYAHLVGRIYCTPRALWKLNWFLRDFGYDADLLSREQIDDKALVGLVGIVRTSRGTSMGRAFLKFEAFAPQSEWKFLSSTTGMSAVESEGQNDV
jgi:hypothetical protein